MAEQVVEAKEWEESCTRTSTLDQVHSTEAMVKHRGEMNEQLVEHDIEMDMNKEKVWTRKDEKGGPKKTWKWLDWGCSMARMSFAFPAGKVQVHAASFGL